MATDRMPIDRRDWYYVDEFAELTGNTVAYIRELCNLTDKDKGIRATKCGKTWRIPKSERDRKLGIETDEDSYKKEIYIKNLEIKLKEYEVKFNAMENLLKSATNVLNS